MSMSVHQYSSDETQYTKESGGSHYARLRPSLPNRVMTCLLSCALGLDVLFVLTSQGAGELKHVAIVVFVFVGLADWGAREWASGAEKKK